MSLDKAIAHGKEHRKPYRGSKAIDCTCRNHGSCQRRKTMTDYEELVAELRKMQSVEYCVIASSEDFPAIKIVDEAADAIEELLKVAKKMHLWIFLNSGDEQKAYDWCGLSDEMNAALGYSGQFDLRAEPPKGEAE